MTTGDLTKAYLGVTHTAELGFVFNNPDYLSPWSGYATLAEQMSAQWIYFVNHGSPNGDGVPYWPMYNTSQGGVNLVLRHPMRNGSFVEKDTYRQDGIAYLQQVAWRRSV